MEINEIPEQEHAKVEQVPTTIPEVSLPVKQSEVNLDEKFPAQQLKFEKGNIKVRDLVPENLKEGGEIPIVIMAGWAMKQDVVGNTARGLYDLGRRVMPLDIEGGAQSITGRFQNEIDRQADTVYEWIKSNPDQKFRFAPQSMSALIILSMVDRHSDVIDQIDGIVELSPMGHAGDSSDHTLEVSDPKYFAESQEKKKGFKARIMDTAMKVGGKSMYDMLQRKFAEDARNNEREKTEEDAQIEARVMESLGKSMDPRKGGNPIKSAREAFEMARADKYNVLNLLKSKGIKVGIIQGAQDRLNSAQGLVENISRQSIANSGVDEKYSDERGIEKLPEELKILETDSPEVTLEKQKKIVQLKMELTQKENRVPLDALVLVEGGHEITGPYGFARDINRAFDYLDHPENYRKILDENLRKNEEARKVKEKKTQGLKEARQELTQITSENHEKEQIEQQDKQEIAEVLEELNKIENTPENSQQ